MKSSAEKQSYRFQARKEMMEMKKAMTLIGGVVLATLVAIGGAFAQKANHTGSIQIKSDDEAVYGDMAKISLDSAVSAALKAVPGKVLKVRTGKREMITAGAEEFPPPPEKGGHP